MALTLELDPEFAAGFTATVREFVVDPDGAALWELLEERLLRYAIDDRIENAVAAGARQESKGKPERPNILYFYVDDMGWGSIGPNGQAKRRADGLPSVRTPNLDTLASASLSDVLSLWQGLGYNRRAKALRETARLAVTEHGGRLPDSIATLLSLPGVGQSTAGALTVFAFGRPAFPVDTHVHRLTKRLGLIGPKVTADKAHKLLENVDRPETYYAMHLNLIRHGRETCTARQPKCETCVLQNACNYYQED